MTIWARRRRVTRRSASSACSPCSICSTATSVTPISPKTGFERWWDFWENNSRSARKRPWMPSPGNHENELGNGPIGYHAYQTYFSVPEAAGQTEVTRGLWYAFTAGSMRVISIANDDVVYQDGGNSYVRGYSAGAQKAWLEKRTGGSPSRSRYRLDRRLHASGRNFDGRQVQRRGPRDSRGVGAAVRQIRRRSRGLRARASLRALAPDPRPEVERDTDAGARRDRHRRDRHHQRHGAHGHRRRRNVRAVEPAVLQSAGVSGHHRRRRTRPGDRQATAGLCEGARALVGGAKRRAFLWLRGIHRRSGITTAATSPRSRSPITTWSGRAVSWPRSKPSRCAVPAATRSFTFTARRSGCH